MRTRIKLRKLGLVLAGTFVLAFMGNDSPPALITHAQIIEGILASFEKESIRHPLKLGAQGYQVVQMAKGMIANYKKEIETEAARMRSVPFEEKMDYEDTIVQATLRYINMMSRTYFLYAKSAHHIGNDISKMSFDQLSILDLRLPRELALKVNAVGTYLTPKHDTKDWNYWWFTLPQSDRMLAELFALSRNDETDLALSQDFISGGQAESDLVKKYRESAFRVTNEVEYAKLLQFISLRETLFNRWVLNFLRGKPIAETKVHSCGSGYLSFKSASGGQLPSQMDAYQAWAEQRERNRIVLASVQDVNVLLSHMDFATPEQHYEIFIETLKRLPEFKLSEQRIIADLQTKQSKLFVTLKEFKDSTSGKTFAQSIYDNVQLNWKAEGEDIVRMANLANDDLHPETMAARTAYFAVEKHIDSATVQIAAELFHRHWAGWTPGEESGFDRAKKIATDIYNEKYRHAFAAKAQAAIVNPYANVLSTMARNKRSQEEFDKKVEIMMPAIRSVMPWSYEVRSLMNYQIREAATGEYEDELLRSKSGTPRVGKIDNIISVIQILESRLGLKSNAEVAGWISAKEKPKKGDIIRYNDPELRHLYDGFFKDFTEEYQNLVLADGDVAEVDPEQKHIAMAFNKAVATMREKAKPTFLMKMLDYVSKQPDSKDKDVGTVLVERRNMNLGNPNAKKLPERVEKLLAAMGVDGRKIESNSDVLASDYDRLKYGTLAIYEAVAIHPMLGITLFDQEMTDLMFEPKVERNLFGVKVKSMGAGQAGTIITFDDQTRYPGIAKVSGKRHETSLVTQLGRYYYSEAPKVLPPRIHEERVKQQEGRIKNLIRLAVESAAAKSVGMFETFCKANPLKWDEDQNFKKIFKSSTGIRSTMVENPAVKELDRKMIKELRTPMEVTQEVATAVMQWLFYVTMVVLIFTFPLSPLAAVGSMVGRLVGGALIPTTLATMGSALMFWGFNTAMVANMVARTTINFYEAPIEVRFNEAVAAQNFGDVDRSLTTWAAVVEQQEKLKASQSAAVTANTIDGLFTMMFVSQLRQLAGFKGTAAAKEFGLVTQSRVDRMRNSQTSLQEYEASIKAAGITGPKPSRYTRLKQTVERQVGKISRILPKYQSFNFNQVMLAYRNVLKKSFPTNLKEAKPGVEAYIEYITQREAAAGLTTKEMLQRPDLVTWWLAPRVWAKNAWQFLKTGKGQFLKLNQGTRQLIEDTNLLRRAFLAEKKEIAKSVADKMDEAIRVGEGTANQPALFVDWITDIEAAFLPEMAHPYPWWKEWYARTEADAFYRAVLDPGKKFFSILGSFAPTEYRPMKSWLGQNHDELIYTQEGKATKAMNDAHRERNGLGSADANPLLDLDYISVKAIEGNYRDLLRKGIIDSSGQVIKPLSSLSMAEKTQLERYLRGDNFKHAMRQSGLDFKDPEQVSQYMDVVEFYQQMQAIDGVKILKDKTYIELRRALDKKLGIPDHSLEELIENHAQAIK